MTSLKRNKPRKLMYLSPWTTVVVPGVVKIIVLVMKNISVATKPPATPALGFR
jgi:hypothetical protein